VFAIIMTIMVLQLKVPHGTGLEAFKPVLPVFLSYVLSFIYVAIYWKNHHHLLCTVERVSGGIQWANLHLLFWVSLFPLTTGRLGENHAASIPRLWAISAREAAYMVSVIEVQAPSAASRRSYGPGPVSVPPTERGSSATSW